jgi:hypothetical protein
MGFPLLQKSVEMCLGRQIGVPAKFWNFVEVPEFQMELQRSSKFLTKFQMVNKLAYKPSFKDIMDKYYEMFPDNNQSESKKSHKFLGILSMSWLRVSLYSNSTHH